MSDLTTYQHSFQSMGTDIEVLILNDSEAQAREAFREAEELAGQWMLTFSRFRPDSELSRLNACAGQTVPVSDRLFGAVELAVRAFRMSGGLFNPLILPALVAHGYDRSFDLLGSGAPVVVATRVPAGADEIVLDADHRSVLLPPGSALDLGGIAKGLYADLVAERFGELRGGVVSAGGDLRTWGEGPDDGGWAVGVEQPAISPQDAAVVVLRDGGVATSGTNRRRWGRGQAIAHHLIDPRTGRPAESIDRTVTVLAPTAAMAEIGSTAYVIDPTCRDCEELAGHLWALIAIDHDYLISFAEFDPEAPINVYFNQ